VSTPTDDDGSVDLRAVRSAAYAVLDAAQHESPPLVVVKSTCPVGTADALAAELGLRAGQPVRVVVNPEFLSQGTAVRDAMHPSRVVIGAADERDAACIAAIHAPFDAPVVCTDRRSAELIKYAANAFLATRVSFINEVAALCEAVGADVTELAAAIGLDARIGPAFLAAGIGFGGSCLPKDLRGLARMGREHAVELPVVEAALATNNIQPARTVARLRAVLGTLDGKTVALLGLAFKPQTDDLREAPSLALISALRAAGASVRAHDPVVVTLDLEGVTLAGDEYEVAAGADAVVLVTEWPQFQETDLVALASAMRGDVLFDLRNALDREACVAAGLRYFGVGRSARLAPAVFAK
jgi:UDPglucose 6-dehydrogenase